MIKNGCNMLGSNLTILGSLKKTESIGETKLKLGGGDAGHRGVRSISQHLGTKDFNRIRMGIGRPRVKEEVSSFVLSNFSKNESARAKILIKNLCDDFEKIIRNNPSLAIQRNL